MYIIDSWGNWVKEDWTDTIWRMVENAEVGKILYEKFAYLDDKAQNLMLKQVFSEIVYRSKCFTKNQQCCWHNDHNPSLYYDFRNHNFHCFGCMQAGEHRDVIDFAKFILHTNKYHEARNFLIECLVENGEEAIRIRRDGYKNRTHRGYAEENAKKALSAYAPSALGIKSTRDFLSNKTNGLSDDAVYMPYFDDCRYCAVSGKEYLAIKCDNGYFAKRCIDEQNPSKYINFKGEKVQLYNGQAITTAVSGDVIVVVESALDAILLSTLSIKSVAINGVQNVHLLRDCIENTNKDFVIIIMMDNDEAGRRASKNIYSMLCDMGISCYEHYTLCNSGVIISEKDFGDAFIKNRLETSANAIGICKKLSGVG